MSKRDWSRSNWRQRVRERGYEDVKGGGLPLDITERPVRGQLSRAELRQQAERAMAGYTGPITRCPPTKR